MEPEFDLRYQFGKQEGLIKGLHEAFNGYRIASEARMEKIEQRVTKIEHQIIRWGTLGVFVATAASWLVTNFDKIVGILK